MIDGSKLNWQQLDIFLFFFFFTRKEKVFVYLFLDNFIRINI